MEQKKAWQGIAPILVQPQYNQGGYACCGIDNSLWKICQTSIVALSSKGNRPKPNGDYPKDVSSASGAAGKNPKAQVSASRQIHKVDSTYEMITDSWDTVIQFYDIAAAVALIYMKMGMEMIVLSLYGLLIWDWIKWMPEDEISTQNALATSHSV